MHFGRSTNTHLNSWQTHQNDWNNVQIVEVEVVKELTPEQKAFYENKISDLESQIAQLKSPNIDYWGRPKNISKKSIDDLTAEQKIEQRYQRLVEEVRAGKLDLQTLTHAEAEIVQKLINE